MRKLRRVMHVHNNTETSEGNYLTMRIMSKLLGNAKRGGKLSKGTSYYYINTGEMESAAEKLKGGDF